LFFSLNSLTLSITYWSILEIAAMGNEMIDKQKIYCSGMSLYFKNFIIFERCRIRANASKFG
ncbi:hypothetical protein, partial [Corynebacterium striatum]